MNERIRELAEQADENYTGIHDDLITLVGNEAIQKFALLIVRECIDKFIQHGAVSEDGAIVKDIKEHFGVE